MINRKKIEVKKKEKRDALYESLLMKCDICHLSHFNEVFILRKERFVNKGKGNWKVNPKKTNRVCWGCAQWLFRNRLYDFGTYWKNLFFYQLHVKDKNREKYMVIHA